MRLTFRGKLMSIVGIAAFAFGALIVTGAVITNRVEQQLSRIERMYVPKIDLQPQLEGQLDRIQRAFQDAVAIHDAEGLTGTREPKGRFLERLDAARNAVDPADAESLRGALEDYYAAADDVAHRLIADETGEAVVTAVADMQAKRLRVRDRVNHVAALDRHELAAAFSAASQAARFARSVQLAIGSTCMVVVVALSLWLSRGVVRAVAELADGFRHFGSGDFGRSISVESHDELGALAAQANDMAARLERARRDRERAEGALVIANRELEAFSYSVAHDLRAPLRGINGFSRALVEDYGEKLDDEGRGYLERIAGGAQRMGELIDALLGLARVTRTELHRESVDLSRVADGVLKRLRSTQPERDVDFVNEGGIVAHADPPLVQAVMENLLGNAWKFTGGRGGAQITFGLDRRGAERAYYVRDNGAGFDMAYAAKLFAPFQRLHTTTEFAGTGIGLATVKRIVDRHGGRIWAEGVVGQGATFYFTLPPDNEGASS